MGASTGNFGEAGQACYQTTLKGRQAWWWWPGGKLYGHDRSTPRLTCYPLTKSIEWLESSVV